MTFKNFHSMIKTQFNANLKVFHTDNGTAYFNSILDNYFLSNGILHTSSCAGTSQQNGIAERKDRHLLEIARALMFTSSVPKIFWGEAILTTIYLINRMLSRVLKYNTPLWTLLQTYPDAHHVSNLPLKTFGCASYVHVSSPNHSKLDPRALKCVFLGYKCYQPSTWRMYVSFDVTFTEEQSFYSTTLIQGGALNEVSCSDICLPKAISDFGIQTHPLSKQSYKQPQSQPKTTNLLVYQWRNKNHQELQPISEPPPHESESLTSPNVSDLPPNSTLRNEIFNIEPVIVRFLTWSLS